MAKRFIKDARKEALGETSAAVKELGENYGSQTEVFESRAQPLTESIDRAVGKYLKKMPLVPQVMMRKIQGKDGQGGLIGMGKAEMTNYEVEWYQMLGKLNGELKKWYDAAIAERENTLVKLRKRKDAAEEDYEAYSAEAYRP